MDKLIHGLTAEQLVEVHEYLKPIVTAVSFDRNLKALVAGQPDFKAKVVAVLNDDRLRQIAVDSYAKAKEDIEKRNEARKDFKEQDKIALKLAKFVKSGQLSEEKLKEKYPDLYFRVMSMRTIA